eukprot:gene6184-6422_t
MALPCVIRGFLQQSGSLAGLLQHTAAAAGASAVLQKRTASSHAENTNTFLREALNELEYPDKLQKLLLTPNREMGVELVVQMDSGEIEVFNAYRVQHNNSRGPFKGGLRYHHQVDLDDGGVTVDPKKLSERELEKLTRKLVQAIKEIIGPSEDIPAPDMNTGAREMAWFFDEYSKYKGFSPGVVTGKPVHLHGSLGREAATGRGTVFAIRELLKATHAGKISDHTFVIQVLAVSDVSTALYNENGLDMKALKAHTAQGKPLSAFQGGGDTIDKDELLTLECDVLIPAAIGGVIHEGNAANLKCKFVAEAANGPTTPEGDAILRDKGIVVLPDIYTNGGGVTVSFFEWVQNLQNFKWDEEDVNRKLDRNMTDAFHKIWAIHTDKKVPLRVAAFVKALQEVTRAEIHRGFD